PSRSLCLIPPHPPRSTLFPYTTLFRSSEAAGSSRRQPAHAQGHTSAEPIDRRYGRGIAGHATDGNGLEIRRRRNQVIRGRWGRRDRKSTRLNSSHRTISYAVFCLKKKK